MPHEWSCESWVVFSWVFESISGYYGPQCPPLLGYYGPQFPPLMVSHGFHGFFMNSLFFFRIIFLFFSIFSYTCWLHLNLHWSYHFMDPSLRTFSSGLTSFAVRVTTDFTVGFTLHKCLSLIVAFPDPRSDQQMNIGHMIIRLSYVQFGIHLAHN